MVAKKTKGVESKATQTDMVAEAELPKQATLAECNTMQMKANAAQKAAAARLDNVARVAVEKEMAKMAKEG